MTKTGPAREFTTDGKLTVSMGVATVVAFLGEDEDKLIKAADDALYQAKEQGRNRMISSDFTR